MKPILFFALLLFSVANAQSEIFYENDTINRLDGNGRKTGIWKIYNNELDLHAECEFKDDIPVTFIKYFNSNRLFATYDHKSGDVIIYKNQDTIKARYIYKDSKSKLVDFKGNEIDADIVKELSNSATIRPFYYGGAEEMELFLKKNTNLANIKNRKGKVVVKFVIEKNGTISDAVVTESSDQILNDEAIRLVKLLPRWQPGYQSHRFVRVMYYIPITFG